MSAFFIESPFLKAKLMGWMVFLLEQLNDAAPFVLKSASGLKQA